MFPPLECLDLCCKRFGVCAASCPSILLVVAAIKLFEVSFDALIDLRDELLELVLREVLLWRVARSELDDIDGDKLPPKRSSSLHSVVKARQTCRMGARLFLRKLAIVCWSGRSFFNSHSN
jgi:hypothetical protein